MNKRTIDLLYRSLDTDLSKEEQKELSEALSSSLELREEQKRIEEMRRAIAENVERSFNPFFSARVMRQIKAKSDEQEDFWGAFVWAFRRVALASALAILLLIVSNFFVGDSFSLDKMLGMPQLTLEDSWQLDNPIEEAIP